MSDSTVRYCQGSDSSKLSVLRTRHNQLFDRFKSVALSAIEELDEIPNNYVIEVIVYKAEADSAGELTKGDKVSWMSAPVTLRTWMPATVKPQPVQD